MGRTAHRQLGPRRGFMASTGPSAGSPVPSPQALAQLAALSPASPRCKVWNPVDPLQLEPWPAAAE